METGENGKSLQFAQKHVERLRDFLTFMPKIYSLCYKSFPKTYCLDCAEIGVHFAE